MSSHIYVYETECKYTRWYNSHALFASVLGACNLRNIKLRDSKHSTRLEYTYF